MAYQFANSLAESDREEVLKSIVQTAHEIDPEIAAQLTEKIADPLSRRPVNEALVISELAKSPQKLSSQLTHYKGNADVLSKASASMLKASLNGRGVVQPKNVLIEWLAATQYLDFDSSLWVTRWVIESVVNQSSPSISNPPLVSIAEAVILNSRLTYMLGNNIAPLSITPEGLHASFPGLSTNKQTFQGRRAR